MALTNAKAKEYLAFLGCDTVLDFQKKYLYHYKYVNGKKVDNWDGKRGTDTNTALESCYNIVKYGEGFFIPSEFMCQCGKSNRKASCCGFPAVVDAQLIKNLVYLRKESKKPMTISSGLRCKTWNAKQSGSATQSRHTKGKAADIISSVLTNTKAKRSALVKRWYTFKKANYSYANTSNMGNAVHVDVK